MLSNQVLLANKIFINKKDSNEKQNFWVGEGHYSNTKECLYMKKLIPKYKKILKF